jgi:hypothetical protein
MLDTQHLVRNLLNPLRNRPPVLRFECQCLEYQQVQGPLWQVDAFFHAPISLLQNNTLSLSVVEVQG